LTSSGWLVPITGLRRTIGSRRHEWRAASLGEQRVADSVVAPDTEVEVDVVLTSIDGGIEVAGTVRTQWSAECRRCLRPVGGELVAEVREIYRPAATAASAARGTAVRGTAVRGTAVRGSSHDEPRGGAGASSTSWSTDPGESDDDDEETYALGVDHLDLEPLARDAVLLNLPLAPLCRADCAGLCPICGADLADGDCGCDEESGDPRWAALDALRDLGGADADSTA
jgi:uncharacterized protein